MPPPFSPAESTPDFWQQRYQAGTPRWDLGQPAPALAAWLPRSKVPPGRVLVPGCGRGHDALLLAQHGFEVTAVDFAEAAIAATRHQAQQRQLSIRLLQRDIFDLTPEFNQQFDYVVEHTCFCALAPSLRPAYGQLVADVLRSQGQLIGIFFTHNRPGGPPYGTTPAELRTLFEPNFTVRALQPTPHSVPSRQGEEHFGWLQRR